MAVDIERVVGAAVDAFLRGDAGESEGHAHDRGSGRKRLRGAGALAAGVGLGLAGRAAYRRVRQIDLESAAEALEQRLKR
jgi:hypothetical protein